MKRSPVVFMVLLSLILACFFSGCGEIPVDPKPKKEDPSEPEEPPPDPPPPPAGSCSSGSLSTPEPAPTLEHIVKMVLRGEYGLELQKLLADEVSCCINQMSEEGVVSVIRRSSQIHIDMIDGSKEQILFNSGFVIPEILEGKYGGEAREVLHSIMRSSPERIF